MRTKAEIGNSEWFGGLPKGWNMVPLSALFRFSKGLSITKADLVKTGKPVISYGQIHSKQNIGVEVRESLLRRVPNDLAGETSPSRVLSNGFVFADTSEDLEGCGNNVRNDSSHALYGGYHTVVLNPRRDFNSKYLAYLFTTDAWRLQIRRDLVDVKLFSVNQTSLNETYVVIPQTDVQKSIVSYLDERCAAIDEDVAKRREVIEKLKEYKKSLIAHAVTKGLDPNTEMKDSGVEWIGEVPADWRISPIWSVLRQRKETNSQGEESFILSVIKDKGVVPYSQKGNVGNKAKEDLTGYMIARRGDIVFNSMNVIIGSVGLSSYDGAISPAYYAVYPARNSVCIRYYDYVFQTRQFQYALRLIANGILEIRLKVNYRDFAHLKFPVPSREIQEKIADFLDERCAAIDKAVSRQEQLIEKLGEYRKSIIYHAVTGKIDCSEA